MQIISKLNNKIPNLGEPRNMMSIAFEGSDVVRFKKLPAAHVDYFESVSISCAHDFEAKGT